MYALWAKRSRRAAVRVGAPNNCVRSAKPEVGHLDELVDETCARHNRRVENRIENEIESGLLLSRTAGSKVPGNS